MAGKFISRGFKGRHRETDATLKERIPPGQYETKDFPVLSAGPTPRTSLERWDFSIYGEIAEELKWTWVHFNSLPFGEGKTSPVAVEDVARMLAVLLANPQPHIGKIYHLTGPQSENMYFYAQEYSKALGRTITFQDIPVEPWRDGLLERGLPVHLVNHLVTMADLHRAGRYDRMSDDVLTLTGQGPLSVQEFVRKNAATFTASAKEGGERADG
jgi:hypothetical protein